MIAASLIAATDSDRPVIARLMQLYLYDMAAQAPFAIGADGAYAYDFLDRFWQHPYLFHADGQIAGFALVIDHCPLTGRTPCWFMAEFFVLRPLRHRAVGRRMVQAILARQTGPWHVATQTQNQPGDAFWSDVLPTLGRREQGLQFDDADWTLRAFDSPP